MLQDIRDNAQGVGAKIIVGLFVAVFALWGVESIIGGFVAPPSIARVNGEDVTEQQLAIATQNLMASLGAGAQGLDQGLIEQVALSQLIERILLRQAAENAGMQVSDLRIDRSIIEDPNFQLDGVFDETLAARTIAAQGMNPALYREQLASSMLLAQMANAYTGSNFVTDTEVEQIAALRLQTRNFRFVSLNLGTRTLGEAIPDDEIEAYYEANQAEFTDPEQVKVAYVELSRQGIMDGIEVPEEVIVEQYNLERDTFVGSAERRASHILFEVGPDLTEDQALTQAQAALERLQSGEDFESLALELSSDIVSAEEGGDIGYSDGSAFPQPIEDALLELNLNEVSEPVVTEFGVHLVKLTEDAVTEFASLEEVRERIERDLKSVDAEQFYAERLETLSNLAFESPDLQAIAEELGLEVQESDFFPRSGGTGLFANQALVTAAYSADVLENEFNSDVVELNDSQALVVRMLERREAQVRPIEEVEGEIAVILRTELERERAAELGQEILTRLQDGEPVDSLLEENELEWVEQNFMARDAITVNREITEVVFGMQRPDESQPAYEGIQLTNGTYVVIELTAVNEGNMDSLSDIERNSIVNSIIADRNQSELTAFINLLRNEAEISSTLVDEPLE